MNQQLLNCLDVGHEKIDTVVNIAKKHSASAKLTGAGGGGFVLLFLPCSNYLLSSIVLLFILFFFFNYRG